MTALLEDVRRSAFTITEFCRRNGMSRPTYYRLKAMGLGPREMQLCGAIRISAEEEASWQRALSNPDEAERIQINTDAERRRVRAREAASKAPHVAAARGAGR